MPFLSTDETCVCPYNKGHVVLRAKMLQHLSRCRRANPAMNLQICPFSAVHHVPPVMWEHHLRHCPDRYSVERLKFVEDDRRLSGLGGLVPQLQAAREAADREAAQRHRWGARRDDDDEEDWDAEEVPGRGTYDPLKAIAERRVIRTAKNMTKSEKEEFRRRERARHQLLEQREKEESLLSTSRSRAPRPGDGAAAAASLVDPDDTLATAGGNATAATNDEDGEVERALYGGRQNADMSFGDDAFRNLSPYTREFLRGEARPSPSGKSASPLGALLTGLPTRNQSPLLKRGPSPIATQVVQGRSPEPSEEMRQRVALARAQEPYRRARAEERRRQKVLEDLVERSGGGIKGREAVLDPNTVAVIPRMPPLAEQPPSEASSGVSLAAQPALSRRGGGGGDAASLLGDAASTAAFSTASSGVSYMDSTVGAYAAPPSTCSNSSVGLGRGVGRGRGRPADAPLRRPGERPLPPPKMPPRPPRSPAPIGAAGAASPAPLRRPLSVTQELNSTLTTPPVSPIPALPPVPPANSPAVGVAAPGGFLLGGRGRGVPDWVRRRREANNAMVRPPPPSTMRRPATSPGLERDLQSKLNMV